MWASWLCGRSATGASRAANREEKPTLNDLPMEIDIAAVKAQLDAGNDLLLLDCREADEYATAHIAAARLIPMSELQQRVGELDEYRARPLVVHCHHGGRSLRVAAWLRQQGFAQAQSMAGGIDQWSVEIDRSVPRY
ncbi:MAG: rhodanese [Pirellulales bacterium]|nr:rhodanese [Pirellulales bacterium]